MTQGFLSPTGGLKVKRIRTWRTRWRLFCKRFKRPALRLNLKKE